MPSQADLNVCVNVLKKNSDCGYGTTATHHGPTSRSMKAKVINVSRLDRIRGPESGLSFPTHNFYE